MKQYKEEIPEITLKYKRGGTKKVKIQSSKDAFDFLKCLYDEDTIELFESVIVIYMNRSNNTTGWMKVSQGGLTSSIVDVRLILATALKSGAAGLILSHNHPSGNLNPSPEDKKLTEKVATACKIMDITMLDHLICTESGYYSFADEGQI